MKEKTIIELLTNRGVLIKMKHFRKKYVILITDEEKKIKSKKLMESLDYNTIMKHFFKLCNMFTKDLKE